MFCPNIENLSYPGGNKIERAVAVGFAFVIIQTVTKSSLRPEHTDDVGKEHYRRFGEDGHANDGVEVVIVVEPLE